MVDYPIPDAPRPSHRVRSVLAATLLVGAIVTLGGLAVTRQSAPPAAQPRSDGDVPTREQALEWIAKAEAQLGYKVGDPCPAADDNAPPIGDSPLMGMAGGEPCVIMYWISAQPDMASVIVDGDGNVRSMFGGPASTIPNDTEPATSEGAPR